MKRPSSIFEKWEDKPNCSDSDIKSTYKNLSKGDNILYHDFKYVVCGFFKKHDMLIYGEIITEAQGWCYYSDVTKITN